MGFFKDVISFGTKTTKSVNNFVKENAGAIPVVGTLLVTGANIQSKQLDAVDKAIGNTKPKKQTNPLITDLDSQALQQNAEATKALQALEEEKLKNAQKREKIIIYSFVGFGVIAVSIIGYLIIKKNK